MELPAGGTFTGQLGCNKAFTTYDPQQYACNTIGPLHTNDTSFGDDPKDVKGCAIAIAYKSDPHDIQPDDFTVISVNYTCPWVRETDFHIPSDLPACPPGGCNCMWGWVHSQYAGTTQIYFLGYKCNVTGATGVTPLPRRESRGAESGMMLMSQRKLRVNAQWTKVTVRSDQSSLTIGCRTRVTTTSRGTGTLHSVRHMLA